MKLKLRLLLTVATGMIVYQLGGCGAFLGDLIGDTIFLRGID